MKIKLLTLGLFLNFVVFKNFITAQQDFNKFKTLQSVGTIPNDFSSLTYQKIKEDLKTQKGNLSKSEEKIFLQGIHYGIDDILHSGMVVYGDEVSLYVKSIVDKLLVNEPELKSKLRFYTLKANESNAFSTDQGIVFVTTGLISQLTSEAQLAFVLGHEISHYTEKHVVETFEYRTENTNSNIKELSIYSKDKEFEADKLGLKWYNNAGYSKAELLPSFDVLMYSYLPFDEVEVPNTYFNTSSLFVPVSFFPSKKYPITAIEDYDDSRSSHPNIKKRKEQIEQEIITYSNWGDAVFHFGQKKFEYIRNICRFESIRTDILDASYANALYSIFILEKEFPNSIYLKRMKAQVWLGLAQFKKNGSINETVEKNSDLEGEIASIHYFIKKLNKDGLFTIALREIYDLKQETKDDKQILAIYNYLLKELSSVNQYKLDNFSKKSFSIAANEAIEKQNKNVVIADTTVNKKVGSKYDKIKSKKNIDNPDNFDSTKFYLYGISDIISDSLFVQDFKKYKDEFDVKEKKQEDFDKLTYKQRNAIEEKEELELLSIGAHEMIVVEPMVYSYKHGVVDLMKSEKLKHEFSTVIENAADDAGIVAYSIDRDHLEAKGTVVYNERSTLFAFMTQASRDDNFNIFPVDYEQLEEIKINYGTGKVLFTWIEHQYSPRISGTAIFLSVFIYPILPIYIPVGIFSGHDTDLNVVVLDIEKGSVEVGSSYYFKDTPRKLHLGAHMFNVFQKLKQKKSTNI